MAALTVWRFDSVDGAERAEAILLRMAREGDINIHDAAIVSWASGQKKPRTRHLTDLTGEKAGWWQNSAGKNTGFEQRGGTDEGSYK